MNATTTADNDRRIGDLGRIPTLPSIVDGHTVHVGPEAADGPDCFVGGIADLHPWTDAEVEIGPFGFCKPHHFVILTRDLAGRNPAGGCSHTALPFSGLVQLSMNRNSTSSSGLNRTAKNRRNWSRLLNIFTDIEQAP